MDLADLLSYAQLILATIGIIAIFHRFLFTDRNGVTDITTFRSSVEDEATSIQQAESMYKKILATDNGPRKKLQCSDYSVGIITALPNEMKAAISVLDEEHGPPSDFSKPPGDYNPYVWGSMSTESEEAHNVVIASFPAKSPGTVTAADVARLMVTTFPSIRLGLMVGIGGGVPSPNDIRLGDIVVSLGSGTTGGVVQYDFGKEEEEGFKRKGQLNNPPAALLSAITALQARDPAPFLIRTVMRASSRIQKTQLNLDNEPNYTYQGAKNDRLFDSRYPGPGAAQWPIVSSLFRLLQRSQPTHKDCTSCDPRMLVERDPRNLPEIPRVHYGLIASGNKVIKSARTRDKIVASLKQDTNGGDCLCFEMEAAGLMNNFPCLVIRGISDYADAHKNDMWHNYASLTAAAFARELLRVLSTDRVSSSKPAGEIIGEIQRDVKIMRTDLQKISDQQIHDWLKPSDQQTNFDQAQHEIERYQTDSTWFFEHQDYSDWSSHKTHHIWLHGQSGCGKTVLASTVIKRLQSEARLCLYFFFDFRDPEKQSLQSLLRSLIWQLFCRSDSERVKTLVRQLYEDRESPTPTIKRLKDTFDMMVEATHEVHVVLDALDESTRKSTDRDELLRWLKPRTQYEGPGICKLRTIITSRSDQKDILNVLGPQCPSRREIRIENESAKVKTSIHQYIHKRLSSDAGFEEWRNYSNTSRVLVPGSKEQGDMERWHPIMKEVENRLVDKAGFMFRWASLIINSLGEMSTVQKIKEALESLPDGLDEIYTRSLDEIKHHESEAIRVLQIILFSPRGLSEEQILELTSVNLEAPPGCGIDPTRRMNSFDKLSSLMSTFIRKSASGGDLQIAHSSVRDFLLYTGPGTPPKYRFREVPAKAVVVGVCLGYIDSFLTWHTSYGEKSYILLKSFNDIWQDLSRQEEFSNPTGTKPMIEAVALGSSSQKWSVQEEAYRSILNFLLHNGSNQAMKKFGSEYVGPPLYVASAIGLTRIVGRLLDAGVSADEKVGIDGFSENSFYKNTLDRLGVERQEDKYAGRLGSIEGSGNALAVACGRGHYSIVQMLLDSGAKINGDEGDPYNKPLHVAIQSGNPEMVKLLLDKGADVGSLLYVACCSSTPAIVKLLLDRRANKKMIDHFVAAMNRVLHQAGVVVDVSEHGYTFPFVEADREAMVKMLLEHGGDVNAEGGMYGTVLHAAVEKSNYRTIKLLIDAGADINIEDGKRGAIFEAACFSKSKEMFQLLLEAGAILNRLSPGRVGILQPHIVRYLLESEVVLTDLDGLTSKQREFVFLVARESCNEVILERLGIRKRLEGSIHHED